MSLIVNTRRVLPVIVCAAACFVAGCKSDPPPAAAAPQAMPVQVSPVTLSPVPTLRHLRLHHQEPPFRHHAAADRRPHHQHPGEVGRRRQSRSGPHADRSAQAGRHGSVAAGNPGPEEGCSTTTTRFEVERQRKLYEAGVVSRDALDQAIQAYENSKADYEANTALTNTSEGAAPPTTRSAPPSTA